MPRFFITIVLALGAIIVGFFYLAPQWRNFKSLREDSAALAGISEEFDTLIQNRDALLSLINSVSKDNLDRIESALPSGIHASEFLVTLERLAAKNNLVLRRVDLAASAAESQTRGGQPRPGGAPSSIPKTGGISEFPLGLAVSGTYDSLKGFLADLEGNLRIVDVKDITFTSPEKPSAFDITIKAKTYYQ